MIALPSPYNGQGNTVLVLLLGRLSAISPASLGKRFEERMTVVQMEEVRPSQENGFRPGKLYHPRRMFFRDVDPSTGQEVFCFMAGYTDMVMRELKASGHNLLIDRRVNHELPRPDFSRLDLDGFRKFQIPAAAAIFARDGGLIVAATGSGKTFLCKQIFRAYPNSSICLTCPFKDVALDAYNSLQKEGLDVGIVGGGKDRQAKHMVAVTDSLHKVDPNTQLMLVDECHKAVSKSRADKLKNFARAKFFGFTASPDGRSDGTDGLLQAIFGDVLLEITYQESVDAGNVVPLTVRMVRCTHGQDFSGLTDKNLFDRKSIWLNDGRNKLIADEARAAYQNPDNQVLIMVDKVEHAYRIQRFLPEAVVVSGEMTEARVKDLVKSKSFDPTWQKICTKHDRAKYKDAFTRRELRLAISTSVWSTGVDFKDLTHLVRADGLASEHANVQIPGRLSRKGSDGDKAGGTLIDFNDIFGKRMKSRSEKRATSYRQKGWKVIHE